jgi:hypothetical protein
MLCGLLGGFPDLGELLEGLIGSTLQDFLNSLLDFLGQLELQEAA